MAQQVVRQQAVKALPAPGLVFDVVDRGHGVELVQVGDASRSVSVKAGLVIGTSGELALNATHAGEHGVEAAEDILLGGAARDSGRGRVLEECLEGRGVLLDGEVGGAEVFAEELGGKAEEGLVLEQRQVRTRLGFPRWCGGV